MFQDQIHNVNYEAQYNFKYCQFRIQNQVELNGVWVSCLPMCCHLSRQAAYALAKQQETAASFGLVSLKCELYPPSLLLSWNVGQTPQIQFHITDITPGIRKRIWNTIASISPSHQAHVTPGSLDALQIYCGKLFSVTCPRMAHFPFIFFFVSVAKF